MDKLEKRLAQLKYQSWRVDDLNNKLENNIIEIIEENLSEDQIINNIKQSHHFQILDITEKKMVSDHKAIPLCLGQQKYKVAKFFAEQSQCSESQIPFLHYLIRESIGEGDDQFIYLLNQTGIDINKQDRYGATLLHYAAKNNDIETTKLLIDQGADPLIEKMGKIKPIDFTNDENVKQVIKDYQERNLAFAMINHPRLGGKNSPGSSINPDIVKLILDQQYNGRQGDTRIK